MNSISRFLVFVPVTPGQVPGSVIDQLNASTPSNLKVLRTRPYLIAVESVLSKAEDGTEILFDTFPGTIHSGRPLFSDDQCPSDFESLHRSAETYAQAYNLIRCNAETFLLESDAIGLKPFYLAEVAGGTLMASRIADILALYPQLATVDPIGVYELMTFRTPIAQRTLHRDIKRGLPGARYRWSAESGLQSDMTRRIQPPPLDALALVDSTIDRVRQAVRASLEEKASRGNGLVALALSGGFDSRLIAAVAVEAGIPLRVFSYGRRQTSEMRSAAAVARVLGLNLERIEYSPEHSLRQLPWHLKSLEGTADLGTSSIANLLAVDMPVGTSLLHGYLGDPLAGSFCRHMSAEEYACADTLVGGIMRQHSALASNELTEVLAPSIDLDQVRSDVAASVRRDCPPHQAYLLWEFENRQRTYVGSYFPLLGEHFDTVMPFYDRRVLDLWLSLPPIGQADRSVFRKLLVRYYPALAKIPHSEEPAPITPNLRWQLARFYRGLPKRVLASALGSERAHELLLRSYRHDYIWNLGNLTAPRQRAHMLSRVAELRPLLEEVLNMELAGDYADKLSGNVQALRGVFLVSEYAQHIRAVSPAAGQDSGRSVA